VVVVLVVLVVGVAPFSVTTVEVPDKLEHGNERRRVILPYILHTAAAAAV
jgi:hypothetical protein